MASFLGEEFVEGQAATDGADVDVCKIYCRDWKQISDNEKTDHLHHQFVDHRRGSALNRLLSTKSSSSTDSTSPASTISSHTFDSTSIDLPTSIGSLTFVRQHFSMSNPHNKLTSSPNSAQYDSDSLHAVECDFAGQVIFHNTHSIFISEDGVPVITFDASVDLTDQVTPREGSSPLPESCTGISSIHYWLQVVDGVSSVKGSEGSLTHYYQLLY